MAQGSSFNSKNRNWFLRLFDRIRDQIHEAEDDLGIQRNKNHKRTEELLADNFKRTGVAKIQCNGKNNKMNTRRDSIHAD